MSTASRNKSDAELRAVAEAAVETRPTGRFRVVLEGIRAEYETTGSFAIKFSLAISEPVSKIQHMLRSLPARVWEGENASMAAGLLAIIEEAGGRARIDEIAAQPQRSTAATGEQAGEKAQSVPRSDSGGRAGACCPKCGFPGREGDRHCQFCLSPFEERPGRRANRSTGAVTSVRAASIPTRRLLLYALIVLAAVVISRLLDG